jgi:hypothetical protein
MVLGVPEAIVPSLNGTHASFINDVPTFLAETPLTVAVGKVITAAPTAETAAPALKTALVAAQQEPPSKPAPAVIKASETESVPLLSAVNFPFGYALTP